MIGDNPLAARLRPAAGVLLTGLMALTVVACETPTSSTPPDASTPSVPSRSPLTSAVTSPSDAARKDAVAAYAGMWNAMAEAGHTSDWRSPEIAKYAVGDALQVINRSLYTDHQNGVVTKGSPKISPEVSSVKPQGRPTTALIEDCGDSSEWVKYKGDQPLNDEPGGRRAITAEVRKQPDGSWKVTRFAVEAVGTC